MAAKKGKSAKKVGKKGNKKDLPQFDLTGMFAVTLLSWLQQLSEAGAETIDEAIALVAEGVPEDAEDDEESDDDEDDEEEDDSEDDDDEDDEEEDDDEDDDD